MLTYNQERYINEAIRSVMLQETNFPFELVIGNDASTDCTGTICADWQKSTRNKSSYSTGRKIWDCNRTSYKPTPDAGDNISLSAKAMTSGQTNGNCKSRQIFWIRIPTIPPVFTGLSTTTKTVEPKASAMAGRSRIQTYQTLHAAITSPTYPPCSAGACLANCPNGLPVSAPTTMPYIC